MVPVGVCQWGMSLLHMRASSGASGRPIGMPVVPRK